MNLDIKFDNNSRFSARSSAIIYNKDKTKILLMRNKNRNYYMLPGGRIEFSEKSIDAVKRELKEETGYDLDFRFISIQENFITKGNETKHQYAFCYESIYHGEIVNSFKCKDEEQLYFYWVNVEDISNYYLIPKSGYDLILNNSLDVKHYYETLKYENNNYN